MAVAQVLLSSVIVLKLRQPSQMQVKFEVQLSHSRTAYLWDMARNMQPHLTSSALLSMAASASSILASNAHLHRGMTANAVLLDTVLMGPQQLPSTSQTPKNASLVVLQLTLEVASGSMSVKYNDVLQLQTLIAHASAGETQAHAASDELESQGCAGCSHAALACLVGASTDLPLRGVQAAAVGSFILPAVNQSGYALHPAMLEAPITLRAVMAAPTESAPIWLKSAAATLVSTPSTAATSFTAAAGVGVNAALVRNSISTACVSAVHQEGMVFAAGHEQAAAVAAAVVSEAVSMTEPEPSGEGQVSADSAMLQMDSQERKRYIQAQVRSHCGSMLIFLLINSSTT